MRILNLRILHSPWRGGCGSRRARSNLCTNTSSTKSVSADAATCCHLTQTVSWWCNFLLPPYQTSFMPGAACKPVSCWVQLRAASRASVWRRYHCSKTACNLRILQVSNFWVILIIISIMTHTHTHGDFRLFAVRQLVSICLSWYVAQNNWQTGFVASLRVWLYP